MPESFPSAGELDRRIELQHNTTTNDPDSNEPIPGWGTYATVWAKMEYHRSVESEQASREYADLALFFTIRYRTDIEIEDRIVFEGDTYEVIGRPREIGRHQYQKLQARRLE